MEHKQHRYKLF